jgi:DNA-binding MarR family transcriptional regulator
VRRTFRSATQRGSRAQCVRGHGLNAFHYAVLTLLEKDPRETQAVIADALGYDRSRLVRLLDELVSGSWSCESETRSIAAAMSSS